jgi:alanine-glyoxylate transaminase/serine-glyoxylate transaminase/serine-pyruvate transaminase
MAETGHFAALWKRLAERLGLAPEFIPADWRSGVDAARIHEQMAADPQHRIKAVCVVHNETSTGVTSDIATVRRAIDAANAGRAILRTEDALGLWRVHPH